MLQTGPPRPQLLGDDLAFLFCQEKKLLFEALDSLKTCPLPLIPPLCSPFHSPLVLSCSHQHSQPLFSQLQSLPLHRLFLLSLKTYPGLLYLRKPSLCSGHRPWLPPFSLLSSYVLPNNLFLSGSFPLFILLSPRSLVVTQIPKSMPLLVPNSLQSSCRC